MIKLGGKSLYNGFDSCCVDIVGQVTRNHTGKVQGVASGAIRSVVTRRHGTSGLAITDIVQMAGDVHEALPSSTYPSIVRGRECGDIDYIAAICFVFCGLGLIQVDLVQLGLVRFGCPARPCRARARVRSHPLHPVQARSPPSRL
jgi:hypothetical protein